MYFKTTSSSSNNIDSKTMIVAIDNIIYCNIDSIIDYYIYIVIDSLKTAIISIVV